MATRSLKALIGALAVLIMLFVAAVPASAKSGSGSGRGGKPTTSNYLYWCDANGCYYVFSLT